MPALTSVVPTAEARLDDSEIRLIIEHLPGLDEELEPVFRAGLCNESGFIYRAVFLYSMQDVLHLSTALSRLGFQFETTDVHAAQPYDGLFTTR